MAGIQYLGQVGATGTATGPHKHVYVKDLASGKYLDPSTIRTPLMGLRIGENRIPALRQNREGKIEFNPEAGVTVTSKHGPRTAPTEMASTFHQGEDWALPEGTPIYYEGGGTFKPLANQGGYGNLATLVTPDKKYEIGLGHMKTLGEASSLSGEAPQSSSPVDENPQAIALFGSLLNALRPKEKTFQQQMTESVLAEAFKPRTSSTAMLMQYANSGPLNEIIYG